MLTDEQIYDNKMKYLTIISRLNVDLTQFVKYLDEISFFEKPATNQFEFSYAGGLCEQALKECHELGVLCTAYAPDRYSEEDIIKVALLRNIYRAEMYELYSRNIRNEITGQWETVLAYRLSENRRMYGDVGLSSYLIIRNFFELTTEQVEAIIQTASVNNYSVDIRGVTKKYPLIALVKMAELVVNNIIL